MPRLKQFEYATPKGVAPPKGLSDLFRRYMTAGKVSAAELGRRVGKKEQTVRAKLSKETFDTEDIKCWCKALGVQDAEELGRAILHR